MAFHVLVCFMENFVLLTRSAKLIKYQKKKRKKERKSKQGYIAEKSHVFPEPRTTVGILQPKEMRTLAKACGKVSPVPDPGSIISQGLGVRGGTPAGMELWALPCVTETWSPASAPERFHLGARPVDPGQDAHSTPQS